MATQITDHVARAIAHLPGYQQEAPNWVKLLTALVGNAQVLEDALVSLKDFCHISAAQGAQLDGLGTILNEPRLGRLDSAYRAALQNRAIALAASGEGDRVLAAYLVVSGARDTALTEYQPATIDVIAYGWNPATSASVFTEVLNPRAILEVNLPVAFLELTAFVVMDDYTTSDNLEVMEAVEKTRSAGNVFALQVVADNAFLPGAAADTDINGDIAPDANYGAGAEADADANGNITPGPGQGGNLARLIGIGDFSDNDPFVVAYMLKVRAAGVGMILEAVADNAFLFGDAADADVNGDLPADADHGFGDSADADANGNITPGPGQGGNFARLLGA